MSANNDFMTRLSTALEHWPAAVSSGFNFARRWFSWPVKQVPVGRDACVRLIERKIHLHCLQRFMASSVYFGTMLGTVTGSANLLEASVCDATRRHNSVVHV